MVGSAHPTAATVAKLELVFSFLEISLVFESQSLDDSLWMALTADSWGQPSTGVAAPQMGKLADLWHSLRAAVLLRHPAAGPAPYRAAD